MGQRVETHVIILTVRTCQRIVNHKKVCSLFKVLENMSLDKMKATIWAYYTSLDFNVKSLTCFEKQHSKGISLI